MVRSIHRFVSCVTLASIGLLALPSAVSADTTSPAPAYHFTTSIVQVYGSQYPLTGRLDLQIFPNGTVRGYYHTSYYKLYIPVAGGRDGDYIWFDIGPSSVDLGLGAGPDGKLHVVATMDKDGSFRGQVYPEAASDLAGLSMQYDVTGSNPAYTGSVPGGSTGGAAVRRRPSSVSGPQPTATGGATVTTVSQAADQYIFTAKPMSSPEQTAPTP